MVAGVQLATWSELIAQAWPAIEPVLAHADDDPSELHVRLALAGPFDVVLQAADTPALDQARLFPRLFFHLRRGGTYLAPVMLPLTEEEAATALADAAAWLVSQTAARPLPNEDGAVVAPYVGELWDLVAEAQSARLRTEDGRPDQAPRTLDVRGLSHHLREVQVRGGSYGSSMPGAQTPS